MNLRDDIRRRFDQLQELFARFNAGQLEDWRTWQNQWLVDLNCLLRSYGEEYKARQFRAIKLPQYGHKDFLGRLQSHIEFLGTEFGA